MDWTRYKMKLINTDLVHIPTILLVDDQVSIAILVKKILGEYCDLLFAKNLEKAHELVDKGEIDLILLDIELQDETGWDFIEQLKARLDESLLPPIMFVTSHTGSVLEEKALDLGAVDFISKPIVPSILKLRVLNLLRLKDQEQKILAYSSQLEDIIKDCPLTVSCWSLDWKCLYISGEKNINPENLPMDLIDFFSSTLAKNIMEIGGTPGRHQFKHHEFDDASSQFLDVHITTRLSKKFGDYILITITDITHLEIGRIALERDKNRLQVAMDSIDDAVIATDGNGIITFINPIAERMLGIRACDAFGKKIEGVMFLINADTGDALLNPIYTALVEKNRIAPILNTNLHALNSIVFQIENCAAPILDGNNELIGAIIVFHDVSEAKSMAIKMSHLANHDTLTDLPNRILVHDRMHQACQSAQIHGDYVLAIMMDIDNFKHVNDWYGVVKTDQVIVKLAKRFSNLLRVNDTFSRIGGDDFLLVTQIGPSVESANILVSKLKSALDTPFEADDDEVYLTMSFGISIYPIDANGAEQLMQHSDTALHRAKSEGKNCMRFFSKEMEEAIFINTSIEVALRKAIFEDKIEVYFQPKLNIKNRTLQGFEALARLKNAQGEFIPPSLFIKTAEEYGLINQVGEAVMRKALAGCKAWNDAGIHVGVAINFSALQFSNERFIDDLNDMVISSVLSSDLVEVEVTETTLMEDVLSSSLKITTLRSMGFSVSLDDFGTGYSSLSYLKHFSVNWLKIDMSFIKDMLTDKNDYELVKIIISLANNVGLKVVAEGVEQQAQMDKLLEMGCGYAQGYLFDEPLKLDDLMIKWGAMSV